jgi:hypothetical protein
MKKLPVFMLNISNNSMRSDYFPALSISSDRFHLDLPVFIKKQLKYALRIGLFNKTLGKCMVMTSRPPHHLNLKYGFFAPCSLTTFQ